MIRPKSFIAAIAFCLAGTAGAVTPDALLQNYVTAARQADPAFAPAASRGAAFFRQERSAESGRVSCAGCHTEDPRQEGRTRAHKVIAPLAPAANAQRFTDMGKSEKWFGRNCSDVVGRACTAAEKADFVTWLISLR